MIQHRVETMKAVQYEFIHPNGETMQQELTLRRKAPPVVATAASQPDASRVPEGSLDTASTPRPRQIHDRFGLLWVWHGVWWVLRWVWRMLMLLVTSVSAGAKKTAGMSKPSQQNEDKRLLEVSHPQVQMEQQQTQGNADMEGEGDGDTTNGGAEPPHTR